MGTRDWFPTPEALLPAWLGLVPATFNLADLWELVVDDRPDSEAFVSATCRLTYRRLDERANRLAHHLEAAGVEPGDFVGLHMVNGSEYLEGMLAAFKIRAVPVNVNYRYVESELEYLYRDAGLVALVHHRQFSPRVRAVAPRIETLRHLVVVDDGDPAERAPGAVDYEEALAAADAGRGFPDRSPDDLYIAYTGGTTGMPKGVLWRHEDIFFGAMGGGDLYQAGDPIGTPDELVERLPENGAVSLTTPPFMHVSAHWTAFMNFFGGGTVVIPPPAAFDAHAVWRLVTDENVNVLTIVGDAMARPLIEAWPEVADQCDTSSLIVVGSGGAILSPSLKAQLTELLPGVMLVDGYGASETGPLGNHVSGGGEAGSAKATFAVNDQAAVLGEGGRPVAPGSGDVGRLARRGHIPLGYHNDPEKTASTFTEVDGVRWVLPGDMATVEPDGTVVLLGRGSGCINTGGEKVFPEEVEGVVKSHPAVYDAVVVGVPDERWGSRVVAVAQARDEAPGLDDLQEFCRSRLAGYKLPRDAVWVDEVVRSPSGKADYPWARETALSALGLAERV